MDKLIEDLNNVNEAPFYSQLDRQDIEALQELVAGKIKELEKGGDVPSTEAEVDKEDADAVQMWQYYQKMKSLSNKLSLLKP